MENWAIGFQDEVWWSRISQPNAHSWTAREPLRLVTQEHKKSDPDPKAFACYGIDLRYGNTEEVWIRFVNGNPKSVPTIDFLKWTLEKTAQKGIQTLIMFWDHASWHKSKKVRVWIHKHNQEAKRAQQGTRLLAVLLPKKSPWLNPIEPRWVHAKRKVMEPDRKLSTQELSQRVCDVFAQPALPWLENCKDVH